MTAGAGPGGFAPEEKNSLKYALAASIVASGVEYRKSSKSRGLDAGVVIRAHPRRKRPAGKRDRAVGRGHVDDALRRGCEIGSLCPDGEDLHHSLRGVARTVGRVQEGQQGVPPGVELRDRRGNASRTQEERETGSETSADRRDGRLRASRGDHLQHLRSGHSRLERHDEQLVEPLAPVLEREPRPPRLRRAGELVGVLVCRDRNPTRPRHTTRARRRVRLPSSPLLV